MNRKNFEEAKGGILSTILEGQPLASIDLRPNEERDHQDRSWAGDIKSLYKLLDKEA